MAKIFGLFGSMQGKVADVVMAVRNGEQIVRKYQPIVTNPNTSAQVAARAKLKLMSQLSAVMGPYIAIPREGMVSSRNIFVKKNYPLATYTNNEANIDLASVQLTSSVVAMPAISTDRGEENLAVYLQASLPEGVFDRIVYMAFVKQSDNHLRFHDSIVVDEPGTNGRYPGNLALTNEAYVVYAYGVRDNTEIARVSFGNMQAPTAESVAKLLVSRTLSASDVTLSETRYTANSTPAN